MRVHDVFEGSTVVLTGCCGTIGSELVRQLATLGSTRVICLDNNETGVFELKETYKENNNLEFFLADVRDYDSLRIRMQGADFCIHTAALKHVGLCEDSPEQAIQTNILGTQNIIRCATESALQKVIFTSSDKAVNPTNVMGASKLMAEKLITAANSRSNSHGTVFATTRFGNVLNSSGSVLPVFRKQISNGYPITLTDERMTRFIMTLSEAADLVIRSVELARGGEIFVMKMPVARISDIAHVMRDKLAPPDGVEIIEVGSRPGEKLFEGLLSEEEVRRSFEIDLFYVIMPPFISTLSGLHDYIDTSQQITRAYTSRESTALSRQELLAFFDKNGLF